jgi:hypothetical protein
MNLFWRIKMTLSKPLSMAAFIAVSFGAHAVSPVSVADLENYHNLAPNSIADLGLNLPGNDFGTEGSAAQGMYQLAAGDILSFNYRLLTNENPLPGPSGSLYSDYAYLAFAGLTQVLDYVGGTNPFIASTATGFDYQTDLLSFSITLPSFMPSGAYSVGFGIVDIIDKEVPSALLVDNFQLTRNGNIVETQGFETTTDLASYTTGATSIVTSAFGIAAPQGNHQLLLTTGEGKPSAVPVPPAVWLMSSALLGLISFNRRQVKTV